MQGLADAQPGVQQQPEQQLVAAAGFGHPLLMVAEDVDRDVAAVLEGRLELRLFLLLQPDRNPQRALGLFRQRHRVMIDDAAALQPLVERREGAQAAIDDVRLHPARPHQPGRELFHVPVLGGLPVLAGLDQPVCPNPQVRVVDVTLDYQGFFGLTNLDKPSWIRLSYTLSPRFAQENPDDFHPATAVHQ